MRIQARDFSYFNPFPDEVVVDLAFSPDSKKLAMLAASGELVIVDLGTSREIFRGATMNIKPEDAALDSLSWDDDPLAWSPDGSLLGAGIGTHLFFIDPDQGTDVSVETTQFTDVYITDLTFSKDGSRVYSASNQSLVIQAWDLKSRKRINEFVLPEMILNYTTTAQLSWPYFTRNNQVADKQWIELWNLETSTYQELPKPDRPAALTFAADGKLLYTFIEDFIYGWRSVDGTIIGHSSTLKRYNETSFSQDGRLFAYCDADSGQIIIRDMSVFVDQLAFQAEGIAKPSVIPYAPESGIPEEIETSMDILRQDIPSGQAFFTPVSVIRAANASQLTDAGHFGPGTIETLRWESDGSKVFLAGAHNVAIFDPNGAMSLVAERNAAFASTATRLDGHLLASGIVAGEVFVYDVSADQRLVSFAGRGQPALSPDGSHLAYESPNSDLTIFDLQSNQEVSVIPCLNSIYEDDCILQPVFSPDGSLVASAQVGNIVRIWDTNKGTIYNATGGSDAPITDLSFSTDGHYIVAAGAGSAWVWEVKPGGKARQFTLFEGSPTEVMMDYADTVTAADLSPDNKLLAIGTSQHDIRIYDLKTGELLRTLNGHAAPITHLLFDPENQKFNILGP